MDYPYEILPGHMASPARYTFQRHVHRELKKALQKEDKKILDFGCGPATFRFYFEGRDYVGFDIMDMGYAAKSTRQAQLLVADGTKTPFKDESFDFVFLNAVLEHIEDNRSAAAEAARVLKKGKLCMVIVPTKLSIIYDEIPFIPLRLVGLHGHADHYFSRKELVGLLEDSGFKIEKMYHSMGLFSSVLKTAYIYVRLPRYLYYNLLYKVTGKENHKRDLYMDSMAKHARDLDHLKAIHRREYASRSPLRWMYRKMLEACFLLDNRLGIRAGGEWMVIARKQSR
jgi:SAM-dependent methyltransferase